jgi:hypothetical protein
MSDGNESESLSIVDLVVRSNFSCSIGDVQVHGCARNSLEGFRLCLRVGQVISNKVNTVIREVFTQLVMNQD